MVRPLQHSIAMLGVVDSRRMQCVNRGAICQAVYCTFYVRQLC